MDSDLRGRTVIVIGAGLAELTPARELGAITGPDRLMGIATCERRGDERTRGMRALHDVGASAPSAMIRVGRWVLQCEIPAAAEF